MATRGGAKGGERTSVLLYLDGHNYLLNLPKHHQHYVLNQHIKLKIKITASSTNPNIQTPLSQRTTMEELRTLPDYLKATNTSGVVILQATATWCSQCKAIAPAVEKMVQRFPDAKWYKYDTDSAGDIAQELGVSQMPVFTIFKDGDLVDSVAGARAKVLEEKVGGVYEGRRVEV